MDTRTPEYAIAYALTHKLGGHLRRELLQQSMADFIAREVTAYLRLSGWEIRQLPRHPNGYVMAPDEASAALAGTTSDGAGPEQ